MRVSVEGAVGVGKSTLLTALAQRRLDWTFVHEPVSKWTFFHDFYAQPKRFGFHFNLEVLEMMARVDQTAGVTVVERSPLSNNVVFARMQLPEKEYDLYKRVYGTLAWQPDAIVVLQTPAAVAADRRIRRAREGEVGEAHYFDEIHSRHRTDLLPAIAALRIPLLCIDATRPTEEQLDAVESFVASVN